MGMLALSAAIWDRNKIVIALACVVWFGNIASIAYSKSVFRYGDRYKHMVMFLRHSPRPFSLGRLLHNLTYEP